MIFNKLPLSSLKVADHFFQFLCFPIFFSSVVTKYFFSFVISARHPFLNFQIWLLTYKFYFRRFHRNGLCSFISAQNKPTLTLTAQVDTAIIQQIYDLIKYKLANNIRLCVWWGIRAEGKHLLISVQNNKPNKNYLGFKILLLMVHL